MTLQTATAARPRLGSGKDLQSKKVQVIRQRRRRRPGGGDSRHPNRPSQQSWRTHSRSEQPAVYVSPADDVPKHRALPAKGHPALPGSRMQRCCN